jgi:hypothetical protein
MPSARSQLTSTFCPACLLIAFITFWFSDTVADPDVWGHVRFGQDILRAGSIVQPDPYSYRTGEGLWINHEWLSEVIFAGIYNQAGPRGLIGFKVLASLLIMGLAHAHLRRRGMRPFHTAILLVVLSIPFHMGLGTIRPQIFTYLFFLIELLILERADRGGQASLCALPIVFAVWVNLHGGVLAGVGMLLLWTAIRIHSMLGDTSRTGLEKLREVTRFGLLGITSGLALVFNPYGLTLLEFLLRTATVARPEIGEWAPLSLFSLPGLLYLGLLALGICGLAVSERRRGPEAILLFGISAILPLLFNRHYPLFAMTLVVMAGEHIADVANRWRPPARPIGGQGRLASAFCLVGSLLLIALSIPRFGCIRIEPYYFPFPARAVALLKQSGIRGNMAVPFDWGEYVIWHLGPGVKVSIDGRRETVYSDEVYRQSRDFERGAGRWDALLKSKPATDLVLTANGSPTANLLSRTDGWTALYQDTYALMFVRAGFPGLSHLLQTRVPTLPDDGDQLCVPAPGMGPGGFSH